MSTEQSDPDAPAPRRKYVRAVGPRLKKLLYVVFALVALLGANSVYLVSITATEAATEQTYQNYFYQYMFLTHLVLGLLLVVPFVIFGALHIKAAWRRPNRRAVRIGLALFGVSVALLVSGLLLMRVGAFDLKAPALRSTVYWIHVGCPLAAAWLYWLHRLAGPRIKWRIGLAYACVVLAICVSMVFMHASDPRKWNQVGPAEGEQYFFPSLARTATGNFIPAKSMMMDQYCMQCHPDARHDWFHSVHHFSSFNNPAYLASVREARQVLLKRDGNVQGSRFCAGCHDPVPFFSGAFDDPDFDDVKHPTAQAGITCTVCHSINHINSNRGNSDFTIDEPIHYPFAFSDNAALQWVNRQLVKAKPSFHKKMFLKPLHKTAEFCGTCHKVHLPEELNNYKFLRAQNHYDSFLLSGVSGGGARSFYYPKKAEKNCNDCHMPLHASNDFGAQYFRDAKELSVHSHMFPSANTGVAYWRFRDELPYHQRYLEGVARVDVFGVRDGGTIDGKLTAPLRPNVPALKRGEKYLLETVIRTMKLGHHFTQGTVDSNEIWLDVTVTSGDRLIGRSGAIDDTGQVDPWSHFVNVFLLDRHGNRIDRRNAGDIFVALYNHQIPPGAGQVVQYELRVPDDVSAPVTVEVKLKYRKFDKRYVDYIAANSRKGDLPFGDYKPGSGKPYRNDLPVVTIASDRVTFAVEGIDGDSSNADSPIIAWQRWNDYGIGMFLKGKAALRQATVAFGEVEKHGRYDGPLNLARTHFREGLIDEAVDALKRASQHRDPPAPPWTMAWLSGMVNRQQLHFAEAAASFRSVLEDDTQERRRRGFDFSRDYIVINLLGQTLFDMAKQKRGDAKKTEREQLLRESVAAFEKTLGVDVENVEAHYNLALLYGELGDAAKVKEHQSLHAKYKPDENARDRAVAAARKKYPAANRAAEAIVIYPLNHKADE